MLLQSLHHEPEDIPTLKRLAECFRVMGEAEGERLTREIVRVRQSKPVAETSLTPETNPMDSGPNSLTSNQREHEPNPYQTPGTRGCPESGEWCDLP